MIAEVERDWLIIIEVERDWLMHFAVHITHNLDIVLIKLTHDSFHIARHLPG